MYPKRVWALMQIGDSSEIKLCAVVTDETVADEWELRPGCCALAADLDVLPKNFTRLLAAK